MKHQQRFSCPNRLYILLLSAVAMLIAFMSSCRFQGNFASQVAVKPYKRKILAVILLRPSTLNLTVLRYVAGLQPSITLIVISLAAGQLVDIRVSDRC